VGELKDYFGVDDGLLVLRVVPGTPAERAGLRGGDVILRVDGRDVTTPGALSRAIERSENRTLKLDVVRKRQKRVMVLKWER
jgi:S1-C subfamily serine protease